MAQSSQSSIPTTAWSKLVDIGSSLARESSKCECGNSGYGKSNGSDHAGESDDSTTPSNSIGTVVPGGSGEKGRPVLLLQAPMSTSERLSPTACAWQILSIGMAASSGVSSSA